MSITEYKTGMFHVLTNTPLSYSSISRKCVCVCVPVCACVCRHIHFVPVSFHNETKYYIIIIGDIKKTITVEVGNMQKISVNLFKLVQLSSKIKICLHFSSPSRSKVHFSVSVFL